MRVTMREVAARAGVSVATVSNVITGKKYVGAEAEAIVRKVMDELDYQPNIIARSLKINCTYSIGVIVPDTTNPFFGDMIKYVQNAMEQRHYQILLMNSDNNVERELKALRSFSSFGVDGIINIAPRIKEEILNTSFDMPMVILDRPPFETTNNIGFVYADNYTASRGISKYLMEKDYNKFLCLSGPIELVPNAYLRWKGFADGLLSSGVKEEDIHKEECEFSFESGYSMAGKLIDKGIIQPRMAIFATSDIMAWGVLERLKEADFRVPQDVGIVGYDDIFYTRFLTPSLTTVKTPRKSLGVKGAELLLQAIENKEQLKGKSIKLESVILERKSS